MGDRLPADHNYRLYSALVEKIPDLKELDWQLGTITGIPDNKGWVKLGKKSVLSIRCTVPQIPLLEVLEGKMLRIGQSFLQLGEMEGGTLQPHPCLQSRIVTVRNQNGFRVEPFEFGIAIGKQLQTIEVKAVPLLGDRRVLQIKDCTVVGYGLRFESLEPVESIALQIQGLGGRRRMGCGVFYG